MRVYPLTGESSTPPTKRRWTTTPPTFKADLSGSAESIALSLRDVADINRQDVCRYKAQNEDDNGHCRHDEFSYHSFGSETSAKVNTLHAFMKATTSQHSKPRLVTNNIRSTQTSDTNSTG